MGFRLFPKEFSFFGLFNEQVNYAVEASKHFKEIAAKGHVDENDLNKMKRLEHLGDDAAHAIIDQLNKCFITPFDREDIHALTLEIDDINDMLNTIVSRIRIYKIKGVNKRLVDFAAVIEESVKAVALAVNGLNNTKNSKSIIAACQEVNRLENVGDAMRDEFLAELFENEKDPIELIKQKEILQNIEKIANKIEDVSDVVKTILVKYA